ncbi:MAG: vanadium-dependent haloperoxidase [Schleiferiaceae bacterium]
MKRLLLTLTLSAFIATSCQGPKEPYSDYSRDLQNAYQAITDILVHDIFSPPVAARVYAYSGAAAYEVVAQSHTDYRSLEGQFHEFPTVEPAPTDENYVPELASLHALGVVGKALIFSEDRMQTHMDGLFEKMSEYHSAEAIAVSRDYGQRVAEAVLNWAQGDNYNQSRTFTKYEINDDPMRWKPTPPDYMDGIEPHWRNIRTLVMDSAQMFKPVPPPTPSLDTASKFYKDLMEVYHTVNNLTPEQEAIAQFWDCNPYVSVHRGHVMLATKKITPGGHWMGITGIACRKVGADYNTTINAHLRAATGLFDGFISCWDEKYRSELVRPETVINENFDENWTPLLQTPPFPEYTSGHSVISGAAGVMLTGVFGENFAFQDSTERVYGLPDRSYESFTAASDEAAISRLYGGIHYMPAIEVGVSQGRTLGAYLDANLTTYTGNE